MTRWRTIDCHERARKKTQEKKEVVFSQLCDTQAYSQSWNSRRKGEEDEEDFNDDDNDSLSDLKLTKLRLC